MLIYLVRSGVAISITEELFIELDANKQKYKNS